MDKAYIIGTGMTVAKNEVTNEALCELFPALATSDEWVMKNVGIKKRYFIDSYEDLIDLLHRAAVEALQQSGVKKLDRIIVGSNTQPRQYPAAASDLANRLKNDWDLSSCWCVDVQNGCPAGLASLALGADAIRCGQAETVLTLGGDTNSRMLDWFDRNACLLMGDGASACVLSNESQADQGEVAIKILAHHEQTDFESANIMHMASSTSDYSPFEVSAKTRDAATSAIRDIFGTDRIPSQLSDPDKEALNHVADTLRKIAYPNPGQLPYRNDRYPYFFMAGAEVLEKIRRVVPDCGYLPVLRQAGIGLDLFEEHGLLEVNRVSDIPAKLKRQVLSQLAERFDLLIPHQANLRGHQNLSAALKIPMQKIYSNIAEYANTSAAATGIALYEALRKPSRYQTIRGNREELVVPTFVPGQKAVMVSFGSGTHVAYNVLERVK